MFKASVLLLCLHVLFALCLTDNATGAALKLLPPIFSKSPTALPTTTPAFVKDAYLNKTSVLKNCVYSDQSVLIVVNAGDPDNDPLIHVYKPSTGQIVGQGAMVFGNLKDAALGKHRINIGVDDGCGVCSSPVVKEVEVVDGSNCQQSQ